jgi:3-oxoacyl-[acyl-carrier protein] reductase
MIPAEPTPDQLRRDPFPLRGRVAVVTGVSRRAGIGYAIARRLAAFGASLFLHQYAPHDHDQPWGADPGGPQAVIAGVAGARAGDQAAVQAIDLDLAEPDAPSRLIDVAAATFGHLDILICNHARSGSDGPLGGLTAAMLDAHWTVNTRSVILLAQAFAAQHDGRPGGRVVFMTSGQDLGPMTPEVAYAASKGALASITRTLADQLADQAITLNTVNPGHRLRAARGARGGPPPLPAAALGRARRSRSPDRLAGHRRGRLDHRPGHQLRRRLPPMGLNDMATSIRLIESSDAEALAGHLARDADAFARWIPSVPPTTTPRRASAPAFSGIPGRHPPGAEDRPGRQPGDDDEDGLGGRLRQQ